MFDQDALTAAHAYWAFGTRVRVTFPATGKCRGRPDQRPLPLAQGPRHRPLAGSGEGDRPHRPRHGARCGWRSSSRPSAGGRSPPRRTAERGCTLPSMTRLRAPLLTALLLAAARPALAAEPPLRLWYEKPAATWVEALPIGNGRLGAMVFGDPLQREAGPQRGHALVGRADGLEQPRREDLAPEGARGRLRGALRRGGRAREEDAGAVQPVVPAARRPARRLRRPGEGRRLPPRARPRPRDRHLVVPGRRRSPHPRGVRELPRPGHRPPRERGPPRAGVLHRAAREPAAARHGGRGRGRASPCGAARRATSTRATSATRRSRSATTTGRTPRACASPRSCARSSRAGRRARRPRGGSRCAGRTKPSSSSPPRRASTGSTGRPGARAGIADAAARRPLAAAVAKPFATLRDAHVADHARLFGRVRLDLGAPPADRPTDERLRAYRHGEDPALVALVFQYGRYLLVASSRPGTQPANLQGIWNEDVRPPWSSNWTININSEMNYWPAEVTNLSECHEPMLRMIAELARNGRETARVNYGARGWVAHHNADLWRQTAPVGNWGQGDPKWANWPMGAVWHSMDLWEHYAFTRDAAWLRDFGWPLLRGAAEFALDWLVPDGKGGLATAPSLSPENEFRAPDGTTGPGLGVDDVRPRAAARAVHERHRGLDAPRRGRRPAPRDGGRARPAPAVPGRARAASSRSGARTSTSPSRTTATCRTSSASIPAAASRPRRRPRSPRRCGARSSCGATTAPAGRWPGR